jgi:hypothetical protein
MKERKPHKKKSRVSLWIALAVIGLIVVVTISFYTYRAPPRPHPNQYFEFTIPTAVVDRSKSNNETIFIRELVFNITAVPGDAYGVSIMPTGGITAENAPYFPVLYKGKPQMVDIMYVHQVESELGPQGFPVDFNIASQETTTEIVTIYIATDHVI